MPYQNIPINFAQGIDTKTDPWQLATGQFLSLENVIFQTGKRMTKREGYKAIEDAPANSLYLTTLNDNLTAVNTTVSANVSELSQFISKGILQPCSVSIEPLIRNNFNQIYTDSAVANNLVCVVYTEQVTTTSGQTNNYLFAIQDYTTQQNVSLPFPIPVLATGVINGSPKVFVVGPYFVIVSPVLVSGVTYLQYFSIPIGNPGTVSAAQNVYPEAYVPLGTAPGWDGVVDANGNLIIAYNTTAGAQGIHVTFLTTAEIAANQQSPVVNTDATNSAYKASLMTLAVDTTVSPNIVYISFWNPTSSNGYTFAVYTSFSAITTVFAPKLSISNLPTANLSSAAQNGVATLYSEYIFTYSYNGVPAHYINAVHISNTGSVDTFYAVLRTVGLASKAFIINGTEYLLVAHQSQFQNTYFLINATLCQQTNPIIVAKIAYENGGGYLPYGLPSVTTLGNNAFISYLYKQNVEALATVSNSSQTSTGGIFSQLGINLATFGIATKNIDSSELAQDLQLSGGYLSMFDGFYPVEHNFFLFPENIFVTTVETSTVTPTGTWSSGSTTITVSSGTGIFPGMSIIDTSNATYIPAGTLVVFRNGTTITISNATTHSASGDNLSIQGNILAQPDGTTNTNAYAYIVTYEWTDSKGNLFRSAPSIPVFVTTVNTGSAYIFKVNIPYLNITQKVNFPLTIVIYRWSVKTGVYNQVTSFSAPIVNVTSSDFYTFTDTTPDTTPVSGPGIGSPGIVGNNILYTTGGVVPDTNAPATNIMCAFDTRLFLVDAEDPNLLWLSKTVIENTPVEMSSDFTIYISPNVGTTQSTGPITALFPLDDKLIIFKKNSIFYMNGTGPDNLGTTSPGCPLGNYSPPTFITSIVGCTNQQSVVFTQNGLMFQSDKGIWILTRGLDVSYIGAQVEEFNNSRVTSANVIPDTNFVIFTLNTGEFLMYDYYYQQWGTWTGIRPVLSSCIYQGLHTVLTVDGEILQQTPGTYLDAGNPVLMQFSTGWLNLASLLGYERFKDLYILGEFLSPHQLSVQVGYDYNPSIYHQSMITPQNYSTNVPSPFGVPTPVGTVPQVEYWRIHAKKQTCQSFQISVQEVFNPAYDTVAGAGFTMSGISCGVMVKRATKPIQGANAVG